MTDFANEEVLARLNVARRAIGDLTIEKSALAEAVLVRDARIAELETRLMELEAFVNALQDGDASASDVPEAKANGHKTPKKSAST